VGRAIALRLASDGFNVALNGPDWSVLEEIRGECAVRGYPAAIVLGDVSKEEAAKKVIAQTVKKFGELNVVCDCACPVYAFWY
jgi:meso-butanediol dehydrogenase/(S,S)-butanediol dehydrogenase/diacetyl reductase